MGIALHPHLALSAVAVVLLAGAIETVLTNDCTDPVIVLALLLSQM